MTVTSDNNEREESRGAKALGGLILKGWFSLFLLRRCLIILLHSTSKAITSFPVGW
jgi:hypothetical protein